MVIAGLLVLLALAPAMSNAQTAKNDLMEIGGVSWYGSNTSYTVTPGSTYAPLYVTFINGVGTVTDLSVNINLNGSSVFQYSHISGSASEIMENISYSTAGSSYTLVQPMNISSSAKTGIFTLRLHYSFVTNATLVTGNTSFPVPVLGSVNIIGTQSYFGSQSMPVIGTAGMKGIPLTVVIENTGSSFVQNVSVTYTPSGVFSGLQQSTQVSAIQAYGYTMLTFIVSINPGTADGIYSQNLIASYNGMQKSVSFSVPVTGYSNVSLVTYYTNPPVIYENMKFIQLTAVFANSGNSFASSLNITASSSSFSILTQGYSIPYLKSGGIFNATFLINAPSASGNAVIRISDGTSSYNARIIVKSGGSIDITSSVPQMKPGQSQALESFTVQNNGNATIYDLGMYLISPSIISVHVSSSNPLSALTANNFTIGQLNPGQSFIVTFIVDVSTSALSGNYQSQLFMSYMLNGTLIKFTHTYNFVNSIQPTSIQSFENTLNLSLPEFAVLIAIIVIIVAVVGYALRSRKKKGRK